MNGGCFNYFSSGEGLYQLRFWCGPVVLAGICLNIGFTFLACAKSRIWWFHLLSCVSRHSLACSRFMIYLCYNNMLFSSSSLIEDKCACVVFWGFSGYHAPVSIVQYCRETGILNRLQAFWNRYAKWPHSHDRRCHNTPTCGGEIKEGTGWFSDLEEKARYYISALLLYLHKEPTRLQKAQKEEHYMCFRSSRSWLRIILFLTSSSYILTDGT